jgi:hypothetical protein
VRSKARKTISRAEIQPHDSSPKAAAAGRIAEYAWLVVDTGLLRTITIPHRENIHINPTQQHAPR